MITPSSRPTTIPMAKPSSVLTSVNMALAKIGSRYWISAAKTSVGAGRMNCRIAKTFTASCHSASEPRPTSQGMARSRRRNCISVIGRLAPIGEPGPGSPPLVGDFAADTVNGCNEGRVEVVSMVRGRGKFTSWLAMIWPGRALITSITSARKAASRRSSVTRIQVIPAASTSLAARTTALRG